MAVAMPRTIACGLTGKTYLIPWIKNSFRANVFTFCLDSSINFDTLHLSKASLTSEALIPTSSANCLLVKRFPPIAIFFSNIKISCGLIFSTIKFAIRDSRIANLIIFSFSSKFAIMG